MKLTPWYLVAFAPIAVAGCSGAFLGQFAVLGVTLCIFFGTLTLGRHRAGGAMAEPKAALDSSLRDGPK
ncbi:MAG TPA: hypothetical protein VE987_03760 [Polyangiaceae bacterium]|nr:hypothetical protein [Polyangiaceae bacterium]